jgi:hypothetical protein
MSRQTADGPASGHPGTLATGPDLDELADQLTIDLLLEAFGVLGITRRACDLAAEAVLATNAIEAYPDGTLLPRRED